MEADWWSEPLSGDGGWPPPPAAPPEWPPPPPAATPGRSPAYRPRRKGLLRRLGRAVLYLIILLLCLDLATEGYFVSLNWMNPPVSAYMVESGRKNQPLQRLGENRLAVGVGAPLLHVGQVGLVGLDPRRGRRVRLVLAGREAAPGTLPLLGDRGVGREARPGLVPVGAPELHPHPGRGLTTLRLAHRASANPATPNRVPAAHITPLTSMDPARRNGKTSRPALFISPPAAPSCGVNARNAPWTTARLSG